MRLMDGRGGVYVRHGEWLPGSGSRGVLSLSGCRRMELGNGFSWFVSVSVSDRTFNGLWFVVCMMYVPSRLVSEMALVRSRLLRYISPPSLLYTFSLLACCRVLTLLVL